MSTVIYRWVSKKKIDQKNICRTVRVVPTVYVYSVQYVISRVVRLR